jgi:ATP-dependent helicase/nuclease subunit A
VQESLGIDLETPRDEVLTIAAPRGDAVRMRVWCADKAPPLPEADARAEAKAAVEWLDPPAATGQQDTHADVAAVAMFAECPRRYFLSEYLGFGAKVSGAEASEDAAALMEPFSRTALGRRVAAAAASRREFDFLMEVEDIVLRGRIDLWFEERGRTILVAFNTDHLTGEDAPAQAARHALELRLSAMALERLTGRTTDEAYICFLRANVAVPVDVRPSLFESPEATVREFREAQIAQNFPLHEGRHCLSCPHFGGMCPAAPRP